MEREQGKRERIVFYEQAMRGGVEEHDGEG